MQPNVSVEDSAGAVTHLSNDNHLLLEPTDMDDPSNSFTEAFEISGMGCATMPGRIECSASVRGGTAERWEWQVNGQSVSPSGSKLSTGGLAAGKYRVTAFAIDASGRRSPPYFMELDVIAGPDSPGPGTAPPATPPPSTTGGSSSSGPSLPGGAAGGGGAGGVLSVSAPGAPAQATAGERVPLRLPRGKRAELRARCDALIDLVAYLDLIQAESLLERLQWLIYARPPQTPLQEIDAVVIAILVCGRVYSAADAPGPQQAGRMLQSASGSSMLDLELTQGEVNLRAQAGIPLQVRTPRGSVMCTGNGSFGIAHDPVLNATMVRADSGRILVAQVGASTYQELPAGQAVIATAQGGFQPAGNIGSQGSAPVPPGGGAPLTPPYTGGGAGTSPGGSSGYPPPSTGSYTGAGSYMGAGGISLPSPTGQSTTPGASGILAGPVPIPADRYLPTPVGITLEAGRSYLVRAEGAVSLWDGHPDGADSLFRFPDVRDRSPSAPTAWGHLEFFQPMVRMIDLVEGQTSRPASYNSSHVYEAWLTGEGKPLYARVSDGGAYRDNRGSLYVTILGGGGGGPAPTSTTVPPIVSGGYPPGPGVGTSPSTPPTSGPWTGTTPGPSSYPPPAGGGTYTPPPVVTSTPTAPGVSPMPGGGGTPGTSLGGLPPLPPSGNAQPAGNFLRVTVHHELTQFSHDTVNYQEGNPPVVSADGSRIAFAGSRPDDEKGLIHIFVMEADGSGLREVDTYAPLCHCSGRVQISGDGSTVVSTDGVQLRVVPASGGVAGRTLIQGRDIPVFRVSYNGRRVWFLNRRGEASPGNSASERGLWSIETDGSALRQITGPRAVAAAFSVPAEQVSSFSTTAGILDVSVDGSRLIFGVHIGSAQHLLAVHGDGSGLRRIVGPVDFLNNGRISANGAVISFDLTPPPCCSTPNEVGVIRWDGTGHRIVAKGTGGIGTGEHALTDDGMWLLLGTSMKAYHTGTGELWRVVMRGGWHHSDPPQLVYDSYDRVAMNSNASRFIYSVKDDQGRPQLARLDVNPADYAGAPGLADISITPSTLIPNGGTVATLSVRLVTPHRVTRVSDVVMYQNDADSKLSQSLLLDEGKSGDGAAGDLIFAANDVRADAAAPGPRTVRVKAEVRDSANRRHATVVEVPGLAISAVQ
jgi:hypothetical protein